MRLFETWRRRPGQVPRALIVMGAVILVCLPIVFLGAATDPNILWKIVDGRCVVDQKRFGHPAPCAQVDLAGGYALLKDIYGQTQYLLIPTTRLTGIESPALLQPGSPNYFADAWGATALVGQSLGHPLPRQDLSLAINSVNGRTQQQLHIHIDCISIPVQAALARHAGRLSASWTPFPERLHGQPYQAMRIVGSSLGSADPFRLLAGKLPGASGDMGAYTLVVAGVTGRDGAPGFVLLAGKSDLAQGDFGSGEELQDHDCAIGHLPAL